MLRMSKDRAPFEHDGWSIKQVQLLKGLKHFLMRLRAAVSVQGGFRDVAGRS